MLVSAVEDHYFLISMLSPVIRPAADCNPVGQTKIDDRCASQ